MNADDTFGEYAVHPVADIFPMMGDDELDTLADDIEANGLREPIQIGLLSDESQVWVLIDGRNRYRACMKAGVTPSVDRNQMDPDKIAAWILSHNLHRRHLTTSQRAAIAVDLEPALAELAAQRMRAGVKADPVPNSEQGEVGRAVEQAASMVGVGKSSVQDAKYVAQQDPDTFERIRAGAVTASRAARELRQGEVKRRRPLENDIRNLATALTKITGQLERLAKDDRLHDHEDLFRGLVAAQRARGLAGAPGRGRRARAAQPHQVLRP